MLDNLCHEHMLLHMKRTTLILDPAIYAELKRRAAVEGRTLTDVVEHLLRLGIQSAGSGRRGRMQLPSYDLGPFLVSPADTGTLASLEEQTREAEEA